MKINFSYLFRRLRRLLEIPAQFVGGDPSCSITVNLRKEK